MKDIENAFGGRWEIRAFISKKNRNKTPSWLSWDIRHVTDFSIQYLPNPVLHVAQRRQAMRVDPGLGIFSNHFPQIPRSRALISWAVIQVLIPKLIAKQIKHKSHTILVVLQTVEPYDLNISPKYKFMSLDLYYSSCLSTQTDAKALTY